MQVHEHQSTDGIDKLYYSAYPSDALCIHRGSIENITGHEDGVCLFCMAEETCINQAMKLF